MRWTRTFKRQCLLSLAVAGALFGLGSCWTPEVTDKAEPGEAQTPAAAGSEEGDPQPSESRAGMQTLEANLFPVNPDKGGGYFLNQDVAEFRDDDWAEVVRIPGIRAVEGADLGSAAWKHFGELDGLESINVRGADLTNEDLRTLKQLPQLEVLILQSEVHRPEPRMYPGRRPPYSATALVPLGQMPELRQLVLRSDGLADEGLEHVGAVPQLLSLTLDGHFTNAGLKHLKALTELKRLSLSGHFDDEGLAQLSQLPALESLTLSSDRMTGTGLAHLSQLPKLRFLKVHRLEPGLTLEPLADWPALEALNLSDEGLTDEILATLPRLERLKSLSLRGSSVTDRGMEHLLRLPNLEELDLLLTGVNDRGLETVVASCQNLRALLLGSGTADRGQMTEQGLAKLSRLSRLEALDLRYVDIQDVDFQVLAIPSLKKLNVDLKPGKPDVEQLRKQSPHLDSTITERVEIEAGLLNEPGMSAYDFYENRLEVEL